MALGIRAKLTLAMLAATLVPLAGFWGTSYNDSKLQIQSDLEQRLTVLSGKSVQKLDDWLDTNRSALKTLAAAPGLSQMDPPTLKRALLATSTPYPWMRATFLTDALGQQSARSDDAAFVSVADQGYFKQAVTSQVGQQVVVAGNQAILQLSQAVFNGDPIAGGNSFYGVVAAAIDLKQISKEITEKPVGQSGYHFIMASDGSLLAHFNSAETEKGGKGALANFAAHPLWAARNERQIAIQRFNYEGKEWVGTIESTKLGWYLATVQTIQESEASLQSLINQAIIVLLTAAGLVMLIGFVIGSAVARPIRKLTEVTDQLSKGQADESALDAIKSKDEIGQLGKAVKRLFASGRAAK